MDQSRSTVKIMAPKMGALESSVRFLGYTEAASFIARQSMHGETLRAWLYEIQYRDWRSLGALTADFRCIDVTPPFTVFRLGTPPLLLETIVDFPNRIVLLTGIRVPGESVVLIN